MNKGNQAGLALTAAGSLLSPARAHTSLVARGRQDAATLSETPSLSPTDFVSEVRRLAEKGDAKEQCHLACLYIRGEGVPQDHGEAMKWFHEAADRGNADAQFFLGLDSEDYAEEARWWRLAADQGHADAQYFLAMLDEGGRGAPRDVVSEIRRLAEEGDAEAQYHLARLYTRGVGIPQDHGLAVKWFHKAADRGNANAQFVLGLDSEDYAEEDRWWRLAADQGHADAQHLLALSYEGGFGVPRDFVAAYMWYDLAASRASTDERQRYSRDRDRIAERMSAQQIAEAKRLARDWKPAREANE